MYAACDREAKTHEHETAETGTGEEHTDSEALFPIEPFYHRGSITGQRSPIGRQKRQGLDAHPTNK
jgi:hypothetical protein